MSASWLEKLGLGGAEATDEQLMWRVRTQDDASAFAQIVTRWQGPIQRLGLRITGDAHRGEDIAQETFTRLFAKRQDYEASGRFSTYLWRIALNLCRDELRRRVRRPEAALDDQTAENWECPKSPTPDTAMANRERVDQVRDALQRLPENYREVLVLRHYEDLKFREIAEVLGIPEGTVKSRMAEGLTQMNRLLAQGAALREPRPATPVRIFPAENLSL